MKTFMKTGVMAAENSTLVSHDRTVARLFVAIAKNTLHGSKLPFFSFYAKNYKDIN